MISTIEKVLFLKSVDLFKKIPAEDLSRVAHISQEVNFEKGETLIKQGDDGDCLYLILQGNVKVLVNDKEVAQLGEKSAVGEMAILDNEPRSASVIAATPVSALRIDQEDFYQLMSEKSDIAYGIIQVLIHRLREANIKKG
ncbi:MAG: hypothetical protein Kow0090_15590 [Myxococcota bacterium]